MTQLLRWNPYPQMLTLRQAMDRLVEDAWVQPDGGPNGNHVAAALAVDVHETENDLFVTANVPGLNPEDIDISIQGDTLTIKGETHAERAVEEGQYQRRERRFGAFYRQLTLPCTVKSDAAEAEFENGVLRLRIPKAEEARERKISVKRVAQLTPA